MKLDDVVPFGRSLAEYRAMFALTDADLDTPIAGIADGPASFNAEMTGLGGRVVSIDPLYAFRVEEIERRFHAVVDDVIAQVEASPDDWVWQFHASPRALKAHRVAVLRRFAADYEKGRAEGRYVAGSLPRLDLADGAFGLALCSHFLFLYSDQLDLGFHRRALAEMLRIAPEVRIFPLLTLARERSPHVQPLIGELAAAGLEARIERVDYELQRGGDEMLRIVRGR